MSSRRGIVVSARVHPGETNSSWMMKGLLEYITGQSPTAKDLRNKFIFKIVPMINPDGVIVGNYRCSLAARDLNRNYRHPRKETFPTVWHVKQMMEELGRWHNVSLDGLKSDTKLEEDSKLNHLCYQIVYIKVELV